MEFIKNIKAKTIQDYFETNTLSEKFFIVNSDSQDMDEFRHAVVKDFPARLDIRMAILCEAGSVTLQLGYEVYCVCACDFINILPGKIFQIKEISDDFKGKIVCIDPHHFYFSNDQNRLNLRSVFRGSLVQTLPVAKLGLFVSILDYAKLTIDDVSNLYRKDIVNNLLNILLFELCNLWAGNEVETSSQNSSEEIFRNFMKEVEMHFSKERNILFYADRACLTPKYFSAVIFRLTGKHAKEWIDEYTILEAKTMLKNSFLSVQQISYELNFATPSHFSRYFRHHTGLSPREYRNC